MKIRFLLWKKSTVKYGYSFQKFTTRWESNRIDKKYSYEIESDYVDWEILEMEKSDLLSALSRLKELLKL
jgi:hypothetical protein